MARSVHNLLVSCVNGGGVFLVGPGGVERWSKVDTTGVALIPSGALLARQAEGFAELRWLHDGEVSRVTLVDRSLDLHDVHWHEDRIHVVATQINTVFELDSAFAELRHWTLPGEEDSQHLNSFCVHGGRLLASRFGTFRAHRGYKGLTRGAGEVIDVETGEVLIAGLSQPHSLVSHQGELWLCDSEARTLRCYRDFVQVASYPLDGYVRGLAFAGDSVHVGLSRSRNVDDPGPGSACIVVLARDGMAETARIELPVNEVYDIRLVPDDRVDGLRMAAFADAVAEYDTQVDLRNRAVDDARVGADSTDFATRLHHANLRIAELESSLAAAQADQAQGRAALARLEARQAEEVAWAGMLESDASRVRARVAAQSRTIGALEARCDVLQVQLAAAGATHAGLVARHNADVAALGDTIREWKDFAARLRSHVALLEGSRSWRWTRPLRHAEPERPALPDPLQVDVDTAGMAWASVAPDPVLPLLVEPAGDPEPAPSRADVPVTGLAFAEADAPLVSIIVASHGNFAQTRRCLESIRDAGAAVPFEVLLVEDASGEVEMDRFAGVPGLRYRRNAENLGYLRSMNSALAAVRGEFVHFLNNDTVVQPGWLDALLRTFALFHDCGMAGSRLVYPDGRLQEAGAIIWSDGRGCNIGRGGVATDPAWATVREVDYASAASVLVRAGVLRELGGFDERYVPAYYEDTDLAFRLRERGLRVFYQPASVVVHEEGLSHGVDPASGIKAAQERNRMLFQERWADVLAHGHLPPGEHFFLARSRAQLVKTVLLVDVHPPHNDRDAGSRAIWTFCRALQTAGCQVGFWSNESEHDQRYLDLLAMHGIELYGQGTAGFDDWIAAHGAYLDHVVLSRPMVADALMDSVRRHSRARVIYYGHDIHHARLDRQRQVTGDPALEAQVRQTRQVEQGIWRRSDVILYPSAEETSQVGAWLEGAGVGARAETMPLFAYVEANEVAAPATGGRDTVLFVGGFAHAPNADGILWFIREVWPSVSAGLPGLRLLVIGADPPAELRELAGPVIEVAGAVDDQALDAAYARARVVIAPLRFGAGVKGKVVEAMRHGVPCVTTTVGAQGLEGAGGLLVADDPALMASAVVSLARDDDRWSQASVAGQEFIRTRYSLEAMHGVLGKFIDSTPYPDVEARMRQLRAGEQD